MLTKLISFKSDGQKYSKAGFTPEQWGAVVDLWPDEELRSIATCKTQFQRVSFSSVLPNDCIYSPQRSDILELMTD